MYRIFLDTNVALDLVANREPYILDAIPFLTLVEEGNAQLFISEVSLGTLIYMSFGWYKLTDAKGKLLQFMSFCRVIAGGKEAFINSMNSDIKDKEDGIQFFTAKLHFMDFFITRNKSDFTVKDQNLIIQTPKEFFES